MRLHLGTGLKGMAIAAVLALSPLAASAQAISGTVSDGGKQAIGGATVYLVPAADVAKLRKAPSFNIRRNADDDEPMEDNIAAHGDKYQQAVTNGSGEFSIANAVAGKYFVYVAPDDDRHPARPARSPTRR